MNKFKLKLFSFIIVILLVIVLLFCNLGQSFKSDIFSYDDTSNYYNVFDSYWKKSLTNSDYINQSSSYIEESLKSFNVLPVNDNKYIYTKTIYTPSYKYISTLEVVSKYGKTIKSYSYGTDFLEDLRGSITSGYVKSKISYLDNYNENPKDLSEIVLFNGYNNVNINTIKKIDDNLIYYGAASVISPSLTGNLKNDSGINDDLLLDSKNSLVKFIVTQKVFDELKDFSKKDYTLKIKSGVEVEQTQLKNIYGVIRGKHSYYEPLVIACFYDGEYKNAVNLLQNNSSYQITPSIFLEALHSIYSQRNNKPSRDIIFAFLSGYSQNKNSIDDIKSISDSSNIIFFDLFGTSQNVTLIYNNINKDLEKSFKKTLEENSFNVISQTISNSNKNFINISSIPEEKNNITNFQLIYKSSKALLSTLDNECYNVDFVTLHFRNLKKLKNYIRSNSALISIITIGLLIIIVITKVPENNKKI